MLERRKSRLKREAFEWYWNDLRDRLRKVCDDLAPDELAALTRRMTRLKFRWDSSTATLHSGRLR